MIMIRGDFCIQTPLHLPLTQLQLIIHKTIFRMQKVKVKETEEQCFKYTGRAHNIKPTLT